MDKNLYDILGVDQVASPETIKAAYRKLAKLHHVDTGSGKGMEEINLAYEVLSDPKRRAQYDENQTTDDPKDAVEVAARGVFLVMCESIFLKSDDLPIEENIHRFKTQIEQTYSRGLAHIENMRQRVANARSRITKSPERDLLGGLLSQTEEELNQEEQNIEHNHKVETLAVSYFDQYKFREQPSLKSTKKIGRFLVNI
jgi:curved DNA-binding protein CbpA